MDIPTEIQALLLCLPTRCGLVEGVGFEVVEIQGVLKAQRRPRSMPMRDRAAWFWAGQVLNRNLYPMIKLGSFWVPGSFNPTLFISPPERTNARLVAVEVEPETQFSSWTLVALSLPPVVMSDTVGSKIM